MHRTRRDRNVPGDAAGESEEAREQAGGTSDFACVCESTERHADQDIPADSARSAKSKRLASPTN